MTLDQIRSLVVTAMFSDDVLMSKLVLKGGNALDLIYHVSHRSSADIDFSIEDDFTNVTDVRTRIFRTLKDRFDSAGYVVFDEKFLIKPSVVRTGQSPRWGGYRVEFKLMPRAKAQNYTGSLERMRCEADVVGPDQQRVFGIDISKYEFCSGKVETDLNDYTVYVYSLPMLAIEKLRAICQQLPGYALQTTPRARARDFFDIHTIVTQEHIDLTTQKNQILLANIFAAKEVPLEFLGRVGEQKDFHRQDWPSVIASVAFKLSPYDFYFDFVTGLARRLHALGIK